MPKRLEWSIRSENDAEKIIEFYAETASPQVAERFLAYLEEAARRLTVLPMLHREGKRGNRECVMKIFPYTLIYREKGTAIRIVRVLHQAREYFN